MAGEKILVVDDARNIREVFTAVFDEYNIVTAASGKEALNILDRPHDIDLIVLDVMLPDINGLELLKQIKEKNREFKIVIMTGHSTKDIAIEALRGQADEYIEKPFDIEHTREVFERLLKDKRKLNGKYIGDRGDKIKFTQRLIRGNYNKPLSLQDISKEVFLSYKYLSRIFKEKTGKSFNEYRLGLKMGSAKQFLRKNNYTVSQIAYKVGYHNPDSFMKMFKRVTGLTPSQYRNNNKQKRVEKKYA
jgi:YesN/AraC family two-component response regulator